MALIQPLQSSSPSTHQVRIKWIDHFNSGWVAEDCETITSQEGLNSLYHRLVSNKEIIPVPQQAIHLRGPLLPDFERDSYSFDEQEHLLHSLLSSQLFLAEVVCSNTPFSQTLKKRLVVLQRIYHAVSSKYHDRRLALMGDALSAGNADRKILPDSSKTSSFKALAGNDALIEMGVKTGLSLMFSLLKQNWSLAAHIPGELSLCNDVLKTAIDVIQSLPPLSLANENRLTSLGIDSLNSVTKFLRQAAAPHSGADLVGQQLAAELVLALAAQRGSLRYLLEWVELALQVSSVAQSEQKKGGSTRIGMMRWDFFNNILTQMIRSTGWPGLQQWKSTLKKDEEGMIPLFEAASCLLIELQHLAEEYSNSCVGPDENRNSAGLNSPTSAVPLPEPTEVYVWGSNSSHQLAEGGQEKIITPKKASAFIDAQQIEAGQFCTFIVHSDGSVSACGKGSYGRLGLGDSNNQALPKKVTFDTRKGFKKISSSKGSDGHTMALSIDGEVYTWGDGDYGKLGHGNNSTQKVPKLVQGPLAGKVVRNISAGYRHSAAVTEDGELYTWGEGDYGRLGHGDSSSRSIPKQVADVSNVAQVACGSAHTLAVSADGKTVWSFGGGDNGKLGHGDLSRSYKPKVIDALVGMHIRKVVCTSQSSLALSSTGQVFSWGSGPCLGCGLAEYTAMRPKPVADFQGVRIVDIAAGDSHCLALSCENEVYAWGNNAMGQCGQGHAQSPVTRPKKVLNLEGVAVQQISAGTSHSIAWTALPHDRHVIAWHRPFCIDLQEATFSLLRTFLEHYCDGFDSAKPPAPFPSKKEHESFVLMCLQLLRAHLSLAMAGGLGSDILGCQTQPLRNLLFRLMDTSTPDPIQEAVSETLSIGASLLLPPLRERMELLHSLLPQGPRGWESLTRGQRMQLGIILTSLQDNQHVASVLGFSSAACVPDQSPDLDSTDLQLAEVLMKTILRNLASHTEKCLNELEKNCDKPKSSSSSESTPPSHLHHLLSSLQKHLLAFCFSKNVQPTSMVPVVQLLHQHLSLLLPVCGNIFTLAVAVLQSNQDNHHLQELVEDCLLQSPAGGMLTHVLHALLVLPMDMIIPVLHEVLSLLPNLDQMCKICPNIQQLEDAELEGLTRSENHRWAWVLELARTCAFVMGHCIGGMLLGPAGTVSEQDTAQWLDSRLFSNGLEISVEQLEKVMGVVLDCRQELVEEGWLMSNNLELQVEPPTVLLWDLAMGTPTELASAIWNAFQDHAKYEDLDAAERSEEPLLDFISRFYLATLLKHCGMARLAFEPNSYLSGSSPLVALFHQVYQLRSALLSYKQVQAPSPTPDSPEKTRASKTSAASASTSDDTVELDCSPCTHDESIDTLDSDREDSEGEDEERRNQKNKHSSPQRLSFDEMCLITLKRCIFLLIGVRPALSEDTDLSLRKDRESHAAASDGTSETAIHHASSRQPRRRGSFPEISSMEGQEEARPRVREGYTTPTHNITDMHQLGSLQRVKESLRRLRWRQEQMNSMYSEFGHGRPSSVRRGLAAEVAKFINGESPSVLHSASKLGCPGPSLDVRAVWQAMEVQQKRAESRLYALNQIVELLTTGREKLSSDEAESGKSNSSTTLLHSVHLQLLNGCFKLMVLPSETPDNSTQLFHYQDGIKVARSETQQEIQLAVHRIYEALVLSLKNTIKSPNLGPNTKNHLLLSTTLALSVKYKPVDVSLAVSCGLLTLLFCLSENSVNIPQTLAPIHAGLEASHLHSILQVASLRLLQIIAVTSGTYADRLSTDVIQAIVELLWKYLQKLLHCVHPGWDTSTGGQRSDLSVESVAAGETAVGDFLVFLRRVAASGPVQAKLGTSRWVDTLLTIACGIGRDGKPVFSNLRSRLMALSLLETVLPACSAEADCHYRKKVVDQLVGCLAQLMWRLPQALALQEAARKKSRIQQRLDALDTPSPDQDKLHNLPSPETVMVQSAAFDPEKIVSCAVEAGHTLCHGSGGRGYGLGSTAITSGCYQWKFLIVKENRGNEGTCVGVSKWPVHDYAHRTTSDMWLYRAYSGNLYHNGEQALTLPSFTQGDSITVVLDMDAHTLSFGKNGEEPRVAFEDIDAFELYPCVTFYSSNPGEKVKITDMQLRSAPRDLLPGDPLCAPAIAVMVEAAIALLRTLHRFPVWTAAINDKLVSVLDRVPAVLGTELDRGARTAQQSEDPEKTDEGPAMETLEPALKGMSKVEWLCQEVWPCLVVIGGMDHGLRVGGRCIHKTSAKKGTVLGLARDGSGTAKVQWDDGDMTFSDTAVTNLEPMEAVSFDMRNLTSLTAGQLEAILQVAFYVEAKFPARKPPQPDPPPAPNPPPPSPRVSHLRR